MLRAIFVIAAMLYFSNVSAQRYFREFVDSVVAADHPLAQVFPTKSLTPAGQVFPTKSLNPNINSVGSLDAF